MTQVALSKPKVLEALRGAPECWKYTPVKNKRGFVDAWPQHLFSIHDAIKTGTNYVSKDPKKEDFGPITLTGIGLHLGEVTKTVAVDVDPENLKIKDIKTYFKNWFGRNLDDLPHSIAWTSGKLNRYQIALKVPEEFWAKVIHLEDKMELPEMEIRWNNHQSVLPPSKHPETTFYKWVEGVEIYVKY